MNAVGQHAALDLGALPTVGLGELVAKAALLHRHDRKYVVPLAQAQQLVEDLEGSHRVLRIGGRLHTTYDSTYFDTATWTACRDHVQRRRRRWKVRSRRYVEDGLCRLEVKTKDGRDRTDKLSTDVPEATHGTLTEHGRDFVSATLASRDIEADVWGLRPAAQVRYRRSSLADLEAGTRLTIDSGLCCTSAYGAVWLDERYVLVETKGGPQPSLADRLLWRSGARPRGFSKYAGGVTALAPQLADNDVRPLYGHALHRVPAVGHTPSTSRTRRR